MYVALAGIIAVVAILIFFTPAKQSFQEWRVDVPRETVEETPEVSGPENSTGNETFSASPTWGAASAEMPLQVTFSSDIPNAAYSGGRRVSSGGWRVDFGDGTSGTLEVPLCQAGSACNPTAVHNYTAAGTYTAKLSDLTSGSSQILATVTITITASTEVPTTFSASPTDGRAPLTVLFTITEGNGYLLDFGDGQVAGPLNCKDPVGSPCFPYTIAHTYAAGEFRASLKTNKGSSIGGYNIFAD